MVASVLENSFLLRELADDLVRRDGFRLSGIQPAVALFAIRLPGQAERNKDAKKKRTYAPGTEPGPIHGHIPFGFLMKVRCKIREESC
jgi:hypothetical protein